MASNRAKLSLRRPKKTLGTSKDKHTSEFPSSHGDQALPIVSVATEDVAEVSESTVVSDSVASGSSERRKSGDDDFHPLSRVAGRKRKSPHSDHTNYVEAVSQDQLQLVLALSASLQPPHEPPPLPKRGRRARVRANERNPSPTSTVMTSSAESQKVLNQKANAMLQEILGSRSGPGATQTAPTLYPSELAKRVQGSPPASRGSLWEIAGYTEGEGESRFLVPALKLPSTHRHISHSPQSSPVAHSHSPHPSPVAHISHSSPVSHSHSPQPSPVTHISHSSPVSHSHSPHPSQIAHSHISQPSLEAPSHSPQPSHPPQSPTLPWGVQTLISDLSSLVGSQLCSDVLIATSDYRGIPAHSAILACRCPMLAERLFQSLDKPVHLDFRQFDRATVITFLHYLYTGSIPNQNGMKSITMLAMSLGMRAPYEEMEEQQPLAKSKPQLLSQRTHYARTMSLPMPTSKTTPAHETTPTVEMDNRTASPDVINVDNSPSPLPFHKTPPSSYPQFPQPHQSTSPPLAPSSQSPQPPQPHQSTSPPLVPSSQSPQPPQPHQPTSPPLVPSSQSPQPPQPHQPTSPPLAPSSQSPQPPQPHQPTSPPLVLSSQSPQPPQPHQPTSPPLAPSSQPHQPHQPTSPPLAPSPSPPQPHQVTSPPAQEEATVMEASPLPLCERISASVGVASIAETVEVHNPYTESHDQSHDQHTTRHPPAAATTGTSDDVRVVTPAAGVGGQRLVLESDTDVTPMPDYHNMATPNLKGECSKYGVRTLPKRKMIAKLEEIYEYTHPLIDADGNIATTELSTAERVDRGKKTSEKPSLDELVVKVREVITKDAHLYESMLLYKPLELSHIQTRLKAAALSISREALMHVLDHLCVTFTVPRQHQEQRTA